MAAFDEIPPGLLDPKGIGTLTGALSLLGSMGPTRMPMTLGQSLGQGIGNAGMQGLAAYQQAMQQQMLRQRHAAEVERQKQQAQLIQMQIAKAKADLEMQQQLSGGALGNMTDPDMMEKVGMRLSLGGHPGGAALIGQAEKIREAKRKRESMAAMRTGPGVLEEDAGGNVNEAVPGKPGVFSSLFSSPHVGAEARVMQGALDTARTSDPENWLKHQERLSGLHSRGEQAAQARAEGVADKEYLAQVAAGLRQPPAPTIVYRKDPATGVTSAVDFRQAARGGVLDNVVPPGAVTAEMRHGRDATQAGLQFNRQFEADPAVKRLRTLEPKIKSATDYIKNFKQTGEIGAEDLALAKLYLSMTHPQGDQLNLRDRADLDKLRNLPSSLFEGVSRLIKGQTLSNEVRHEMFTTIAGRVKADIQARNRKALEIVERAKHAKISRSYVFGPSEAARYGLPEDE